MKSAKSISSLRVTSGNFVLPSDVSTSSISAGSLWEPIRVLHEASRSVALSAGSKADNLIETNRRLRGRAQPESARTNDKIEVKTS